MHIITASPEDTDRLLALATAKVNISKIQHILANRHNPADQIKAIKKLLNEMGDE